MSKRPRRPSAGRALPALRMAASYLVRAIVELAALSPIRPHRLRLRRSRS
jgi:hypothetical protein